MNEDLVPGDIFHPGVLLKEELEYRGIEVHELARQMSLAPNVITGIITGESNFTPELATKFEEALGIEAKTWMDLQIGYEKDLIRITKKRE